MRRSERLLSSLCFLVTLAFVLALCFFKVMDGDFWWHLKAGELMWTTRALIQTDPFAYTRQGLPYLTHHEWLSQVVLFLVHRAGGIDGIILLRGALVSTTFLILLAVDPANAWPNAVLAILAADAARPGYVDRPQLFTYAVLAAFLWLTMRALEGGRLKRIIPALFVLEILWVNLHGAAALLGLGIAGAAACQDLVETRARLRSWGLLLLLLGVATFLTPSGLENVSFTARLLGDRTIQFIDEWRPRPWLAYAADLGPFWVLAAAALWAGRRGRVFGALVLAATGYLSRRAFRHEMPFVICATGTIFFSLRHNPRWQDILGSLRARKTFSWAMAGAAVAVLGVYTRQRYVAFCAPAHLEGWGAVAPAQGAFDFLEREGIEGRMFNGYAIGGYLLYRGYPKRLVYQDSRNVDYGFEFLKRTFAAGVVPAAWSEIEDIYHPTYAVIDYDAIKQPGRIPYCVHLDKNPSWKLVYVDDWTAVYLKDIPENAAVIKRLAYRALRPDLLERPELASEMSPGDQAAARVELERAVREAPGSLKAGRALAAWPAPAVPSVAGPSDAKARAVAERVFAALGKAFDRHVERGVELAKNAKYEAARRELDEALKIDPGSAIVLNDLGGVYHQQGDWRRALEYYSRAAEKDPKMVDAQINLAKVQCKLGLYDEALLHAEKARSLGGDVGTLLAIIRERRKGP